MKENLSNIDFYGNKVLQMKQEKDTAWYKAYKDLAAAFTHFILKNEVGTEEWKGKQGAEDFFGA